MLTRTLAALMLVGAGSLSAQFCVGSASTTGVVQVGSEWEQYLRTLQIAGGLAGAPWSLRPLGPRTPHQASEIAAPWASRAPELAHERCVGRVLVGLNPVRVQMIYNSGFPFSFNDGPIAAGRGVTTAVDFGASASVGPVTLSLAPIAFRSENADFRTKAQGFAGVHPLADWRSPNVDLPQRFGEDAYARIDAGQSFVRVDYAGAAAGVSSGNQFIGPAYDHPIVLGNNAGGFPHAFVETSTPRRVWKLGTIHARLFWGRLSESRFSPLADSGYARLASGVVAVYQPVPAVELGGARFVHVRQRRFHIDADELLRPFGYLLGPSPTPTTDPDNQLVSVFARVLFPRDGLEVYGEFGREDRNGDWREFFYFMDHDSAYLLGVRKLWRSHATLTSVRVELLNSRRTHLALSSTQAPWYVHQPIRQGHTHRGQVLGAFGGLGGGGSTVSIERYHQRGRWRAEWQRVQMAEAIVQAPDAHRADVAHSVGGGVLRFGSRVDVEASVAAIYEFNRYLADDATSLRISVGLRSPSRVK